MTSHDLPAGALSDFAPAKINLTLRIRGRRPDGYHDLESLVVFADTGDTLRLVPADAMTLTVDGETAAASGEVADNLVLKAAHALRSRCEGLHAGHFHLSKMLPVAAGIGGGSSDAAAALRLLARTNGLAADDPRVMDAARATGADVPVCLDPRPRIMRGIGDELTGPLAVPPIDAVLVNPRVAVPTAAVFKARADNSVTREALAPAGDPASRLVEAGAAKALAPLVAALAQSSNDLEAPAVALFPAVQDVLTALRDAKGCVLGRMSGSGGTCFGLFEAAADADAAAQRLQSDRPGWWVKRAMLGAAPAR